MQDVSINMILNIMQNQDKMKDHAEAVCCEWNKYDRKGLGLQYLMFFAKLKRVVYNLLMAFQANVQEIRETAPGSTLPL